jgi:PAS domain S-box-containing protein
MGAESYAGVTLWDSKGQPLGLIAVIGRKPMANPHLAEAILGMVAPRAAGELERQQAENALHISLEKYRVLFEAFPLGITITDQQGRIIEGNNAAERLLGIPRAEHTQRQIDGQEWQIIRADGSIMPASEYASTRALNENRLVENVEMGLVKEVGQVTWINVTAAPIPLPGYGVAITYSDITERKLAERAVQLRLELIQYAETHSLRELLQKTLDEVEALTGSLVGFYHFVETDQKTLALQAWSTRTQRDFCRAEGQGMHYSIDEAGVWVDCVRQHHAVIHNDYASLPHRKGLPNGHAEIVRELVAPIMRNDQIVAILGVGNKPQPYTQNDIDIVTYVADIAWEITERKRAEELLYATLREKETMLAEIHHRVKNNLQVISSLLDFQYRYTDDAQARAALRESRGRVHSMALIHEQLYQAADLTRINFSTYVTSLLSDLLSTYQSQTQAARIDLDLQDVHLSVKQAIPCGLIINELVSNAFKYAFPETAAWPPDFQAKICVAMGSTPQDEVRLTVSDNGVGLPQNIATSGDSTLGMFLIETFVQQLRGKVSWSGQPGTTCQITFKR